MMTKCELVLLYDMQFCFCHSASLCLFSSKFENFPFCIIVCFFLSYRKAFHDELALLQKVRHPNVVQFLGAVTQSTPMMIVTEYLPQVSPDSILTILSRVQTSDQVFVVSVIFCTDNMILSCFCLEVSRNYNY